jgi:hypothetical protein
MYVQYFPYTEGRWVADSVKMCLRTFQQLGEARTCNSRDMDFTRSRMRGLDHISGQDSRPKKMGSLHVQ